jgi:hypothetical protein
VPEEKVRAKQTQHAAQAAAAAIAIGFGLDTTTAQATDAPTQTRLHRWRVRWPAAINLTYETLPTIGTHYICPIEWATAGSVTTWYGVTTLGAGLFPVTSEFTLTIWL